MGKDYTESRDRTEVYRENCFIELKLTYDRKGKKGGRGRKGWIYPSMKDMEKDQTK